MLAQREPTTIIAARDPSRALREQRMLVIDRRAGSTQDSRLERLSDWLATGDLLVLNDAATLPASLHGRTEDGQPVELRLISERDHAGRWQAVLFGAGDWRTPTEHRPAPPLLAQSARLIFDGGLSAALAATSAISPRLIEVDFDRQGDALWNALYAAGRPIQYSYLEREVPLSAVQTPYAARPWAVEMPSAGRALRWSILEEAHRHGIAAVTLTHAAGLSSTGDPAIDAQLPLPERYEIPARTVAAIEAARACGGRVVAIGTTVVRALEGAFAEHGRLIAGPGETDLKIGAGTRRAVTDAILTGVHEPTASHFALLSAFAPEPLLAHASERSRTLGYLGHEFGDAWLIGAGLRP